MSVAAGADHTDLVPEGLYTPLLATGVGRRPYVIGHIAQSLDGRIASGNGVSRWISGPADLEHTHRLRALCDAVLVGVTTANLDNPRLTVRRVSGPNPLRVVLDPQLRLIPHGHLCQDGEAPTLVICAPSACPPSGRLGLADVVSLPCSDEGFCSDQVLGLLAERGIGRVLIEGGGRTLSRFFSSGCMDRLHMVVAPLLLGDGPVSLQLPGPVALSDGLRPAVQHFILGADMLFDCCLSG